jgi:lysyl-tRNA synthetase class 2
MQDADWRPTASLEVLKARAELNGSVRAFFMRAGVLEVETPILSAAATVDRRIESFGTRDGRWLQTSPEFAMKRLLAAGSGPIYQIARAFRFEEAGRWHNPEFSLLEWYRPGWDHRRLMDEVAALMMALVPGVQAPFPRLSYREAFQRHAGLDPFDASTAELRDAALTASGLIGDHGSGAEDRDFWLDLLMSHVVGPGLGAQSPEFLYDFPASQSALARIRAGDPALAERFELFWRGIELANGFHELADAEEQERRFRADQQARAAAGLAVPAYDRHLIEALRAGLPDCAGVALGLDRVLMLRLDLGSLDEVLAFPSARA